MEIVWLSERLLFGKKKSHVIFSDLFSKIIIKKTFFFSCVNLQKENIKFWLLMDIRKENISFVDKQTIWFVVFIKKKKKNLLQEK